MINHGLTKNDLSFIRASAQKYPAIQQVVLFGSRAKGRHQLYSDVDLALKGAVDRDVLIEFYDDVEEKSLIPFFFDVVQYAILDSDSLREHIDRVGIVLYQKAS